MAVLDEFFSHLASFLVELERRNSNREGLRCTLSFCEYAARQAGMYATHVYRMFVTGEEASNDGARSADQVKALFSSLLSEMTEIQGEWERELHFRQATSSHAASNGTCLVRHGTGRPYFDITEEQLYTLQSLGFSWNLIANILGINLFMID